MAPQNVNTDWAKVRAKFTRAEVKKMSALPDDDEETAEETSCWTRWIWRRH